MIERSELTRSLPARGGWERRALFMLLAFMMRGLRPRIMKASSNQRKRWSMCCSSSVGKPPRFLALR
jgi:hypothetical protein